MANSNKADVQQLSDGGSGGTLIGRSDDKIAFYGGTTITIPSSASQAVVTEGGTAVVVCTIIASIQSLALANKVLVNELRNNLVSLTLINGAA